MSDEQADRAATVAVLEATRAHIAALEESPNAGAGGLITTLILNLKRDVARLEQTLSRFANDRGGEA